MAEIPATLSYEEAFVQLEETLAALESGDLSLEESLARYELGATLAAYCEEKLEAATLRIRQWQPDQSAAALTDWDGE